MGKLHAFELIVNKSNCVYYPGEVVSGEVVIHPKETLKFRNVLVEFRGEARVNWQETEVYTTTHKNEEVCFHKKTILLGNTDESKKSEDPQTLPPCRHALPFSFKMPSYGLPSSFESRYGSVCYWLKARITRPWRFDHVTKKQFTVVDVVDINCSRMMLPSYEEAMKTLRCNCYGTGLPLKLSACTNRSGYCPGEKIVIATDIKNLPSSESYNTCATLVQTLTLRSKCGKLRNEQRELKMLQKDSSSWEVIKIQVPDIPPTTRNCGIISIAYHVKVSLIVAHESGVQLQVLLPVTIGTVPLRKTSGLSTPTGATGSQLVPPSRKSSTKTQVAIKSNDPHKTQELPSARVVQAVAI